MIRPAQRMARIAGTGSPACAHATAARAPAVLRCARAATPRPSVAPAQWN
ncbi:hypothetical protein BSIN_0474 [Burkholderia singularis]|uniref:Uncharacterized protein n=1 Tax=Burkholderia singularis TaxID=1503053 RepID=A0A238H6H0_9BURK|nr:hypothetical protein BSIN_0474 [Burkholderia singularis]